MNEEIRVEIFGRVQGVGFRHFVKETADKLGVFGYVKNKDGGSVSVVAQGNREQLDNFLRILQIGPQLAKVTGLSYFWETPKESYKDFSIILSNGIIADQKKSFTNLGKRIFNIGDRVPKHVAIIPDGNRRWARARGMEETKGHDRSGENAMALFEEAKKLGIRYLTIWIFSTENWNRSRKEKEKLFDLFVRSFNKFEKEAVKNKIRFRHLGRKDRLPKRVIEAINKLEEATKDFREYNVQICMDYGGRDEIVRVVNKLLKAGVHEIKEDDIARHLDSAGIPDPDLIIRTSGEKRMSGFMPYQAGYSELYFTDVHFPDFGAEDLKKAVEDFGKRKRRFGK